MRSTGEPHHERLSVHATRWCTLRYTSLRQQTPPKQPWLRQPGGFGRHSGEPHHERLSTHQLTPADSAKVALATTAGRLRPASFDTPAYASKLRQISLGYDGREASASTQETNKLTEPALNAKYAKQHSPVRGECATLWRVSNHTNKNTFASHQL